MRHLPMILTTTQVANGITCVYQSRVNATVTVKFQKPGVVGGDGSVEFTETPTNTTPSCGSRPTRDSGPGPWTAPIMASGQSLQFSTQRISQGSVTVTSTVSFTGTLSGTTINGTLVYDIKERPTPQNSASADGQVSMSATLTLVK